METSASDTPAHNVTATVAPFRAWRGSQLIIAKEPTEFSITVSKDMPSSRGADYVDFQVKLQEAIPYCPFFIYNLLSFTKYRMTEFMHYPPFLRMLGLNIVLFAGLACILPSMANAEIYRYISPEGRLVFTDKPKHKGYIRLEKTHNGWEPVKSANTWRQNKRKFSPVIARAARKHQLSHHLLHAIIRVESAYNPKALSRAGAQGLMQLMPATASRFGVNDPYNPYQNIQGGTEYFRYLLNLFNEDLKLALAAYNAGENAVKRYGNRIPPYRETQNYVKKVLKHYKRSQKS